MLMDFDILQIITNKIPIFPDFIWDWFLLVKVLQKSKVNLEQMVHPSVAEIHLQPEENFIQKVDIMAFCSVCCKF